MEHTKYAYSRLVLIEYTEYGYRRLSFGRVRFYYRKRTCSSLPVCLDRSSMLRKRTAVYFWSSTRKKHTFTNTWSSTHIKIHYNYTFCIKSTEYSPRRVNKVIAREQEVEWAIEVLNASTKSRKSNKPLKNANKMITNNHMRPRFVSIGQN
jgi:hypothetical protein